MKVTWCDPPPDGRRTTSLKYQDFAEELKQYPKRWALWKTQSIGVAYQSAKRVRMGMFQAFAPAGSFEAVARKKNVSEADIYARYVGEPDESS